MSVANSLGRLVPACEAFNIPYYHNDQPRYDATAWKRANSIYVDSEDFVGFLQKSPLFRTDGVGAQRRVEVKVARAARNQQYRHPLFYDVTSAEQAGKRIPEAYLGVSLQPSNQAAKDFVRDCPDTMLVKRTWTCPCANVVWEEMLTPRSLAANLIIVKFLKVKKHVGCKVASRVLKVENDAFKVVGSSPSASPSMVGGVSFIPVSDERGVKAARRILPVPGELRNQAKHALREGRKESQCGLPPYTAATIAVNARLDDAIKNDKLDDFRVLGFRPALCPTQHWSVLVKQKDALKHYAEHAHRTGLYRDEKINCTNDGNVALTLFVTTEPKKPSVAYAGNGKREVVTLEMAKTQHKSMVLFLGATTSVSAQYCTWTRQCIIENLPCTSPTCGHRTMVKSRDANHGDKGNQSRGFQLYKPECIGNHEQYPPKTHDTEGSGLCSTVMSSHYQERRHPTGPLRLKRLVLCYYHSVNAYAEATVRDFGIGSNPCLLDRAQR